MGRSNQYSPAAANDNDDAASAFNIWTSSTDDDFVSRPIYYHHIEAVAFSFSSDSWRILAPKQIPVLHKWRNHDGFDRGNTGR
jgi:hypothetical protein